MKRAVLAALAGVALLTALPASAMAVPPGTLDQAQETVSASLGGGTWAQTFTVGITGNLTGIQLYTNGEPGTITASIRATASGIPTGSDLRSIAATAPTTAGWVDFTFASVLPVTSGQVLAIIIVMDSHSACWGSATSVYANGQVYAWNGEGWSVPTVGLAEFGFRTYVQGSNGPGPTGTPPATGTTVGRNGEPGDGGWLLALVFGLLASGIVLTLKRRPIKS